VGANEPQPRRLEIQQYHTKSDGQPLNVAHNPTLAGTHLAAKPLRPIPAKSRKIPQNSANSRCRPTPASVFPKNPERPGRTINAEARPTGAARRP